MTPTKKSTRPAGLEPATYGLETSKPENVTALESTNYKSPNQQLTADLTENDDTIQQNLAKIINRWSSLPPNIKTAIMVLIGGGEDG